VEKVIFSDDNRQKFFASFGLVSLDDFFDYAGGKIINQNRKRQVMAFSLGQGPERREFFIKRFLHPHYKDMLFSVLNFGRPCSQGYVEWANAGLLLENGIETYRPVCFGEEISCCLERKSFFVTQKLPGTCMTEFVIERWPGMGQAEKAEIAAALGRFISKLHGSGISMPDLYMWHIFIERDADNNSCNFAIIDLHRMKRKVTNRNKQVKDLAALFYSMLPEYFDDNLQQTFLESYAGDSSDNLNKLKERIARRREVLVLRRSNPARSWKNTRPSKDR
jgi:tRNA A-37 threonylcarbamoyl transferase component Bud32